MISWDTVPQKHMWVLNSVFLENIKHDDWEFALYGESLKLSIFHYLKKGIIAKTFGYLLLVDSIGNIICFKSLNIERKGP